MIHSCVIQERGSLGPLWGAGVKNIQRPQSPVGPRQSRGRPDLSQFYSWACFFFWFHIWSPKEPGPHGPAPTLRVGGACAPCPPGWWEGPGLGTGGKSPPGEVGRARTRSQVRPCPSPHPLRGLSAPALGLLALSLFFLRRLSIQLELERVVKLDRARELSRMFLPDMMSSPKPS